jgi:hypothetical protein
LVLEKKKLCEALKPHRVVLGRNPTPERWSTKSKLKRSAIGELCSPHYHPFDRSDVHNYKREAALIMNVERGRQLPIFSDVLHSYILLSQLVNQYIQNVNK